MISIITNYDSLISHGQKEARKAALDITETVIANSFPGTELTKMLTVENGIMRIQDRRYDLSKYEKIYFIGVGKGSFSLAEVISNELGKILERGIVVIKKGEPHHTLVGIETLESDHPLPTEKSVVAAKAIIDIARAAGPKDLVITAITGGATSLVLLPPNGITLEDITRTSNLLLKSGANISEMNTVRRHLCQLKGGGLLNEIHPAENITLTMITVPSWAIPWPDLCLADPTSFSDAIEIMKGFDIWEIAPTSIKEYLLRGVEGKEKETLKSTANIKTHLVNVLDPNALCECAARRAEMLGYKPVILSRYIEGEAKEVGIVLAGLTNEIKQYNRPFEAPCALIFGGEVTVTVKKTSTGSGGPNQEFVLGFAKGLGEVSEVAAVAIDTDGNDGSTDIAGGIVDGLTKKRAIMRRININSLLANNDSSRALEMLDDLIITGPTGTNVLDFKVIVIGRSNEVEG